MDSPAETAAATLTALQPESIDKDIMYKMKSVQFLGRTAPIILQNDNGPCPLIAICNVLSLKNSLSLSSDVPEVSQEKLLSLVAERLIDSNISINNKDNSYAENQQQNIADAIDLLPRLATGIDVNIKFRRIDDFEFTPECAIFDLLDIPLYHGWIVDPQDCETAGAIGSKSYNSLMGDLVYLESQSSVDFVAATTAALGVPSPSISRCQSFEGSPVITRKGDAEEVADLLRVLHLSEAELPGSIVDDAITDASPSEILYVMDSHTVMDLNTGTNDHNGKVENLIVSYKDNLGNTNDGPKSTNILSDEAVCLLKDDSDSFSKSVSEESGKPSGVVDASLAGTRSDISQPLLVDDAVSPDHSDLIPSSDGDCQNALTARFDDDDEKKPKSMGYDGKDTTVLLDGAESDSSTGQKHQTGEPGVHSSSVDTSEPIYEGEDCAGVYETREPIYEGEVVLAEQVTKGEIDESCSKSTEKVSLQEGEIIRNFIKNSATQLTVYGLFSLQETVKERELCVFFRNNHFNTMFKYEGQLYILATDQGYINQLDLVWEKLNEVNGDTVFVTGNFEEFKMNDTSSSTWDVQKAVASTAEYLANVEGIPANSSFNSDLQLAIALQQQEFDQQQEQQPQRNVQPPVGISGSRLVTGPQVSRAGGKLASSTSKPESKTKERCIMM